MAFKGPQDCKVCEHRVHVRHVDDTPNDYKEVTHPKGYIWQCNENCYCTEDGCIPTDTKP